MKRRAFLIGIALLAGALALGGGLRRLARWGRAERGGDPCGEGMAHRTEGVDLGPSAEPPLPFWASAQDQALLLAVADVVVPREGGHPAASEIGVSAGLDRWVRVDPRRQDFYAKRWPGFVQEIRERVRIQDGRPEVADLEAVLTQWHAAHRIGRYHPSGRLFELLRQDILRVYYSTPAGWKALDYAGPVRRRHPRIASEAAG